MIGPWFEGVPPVRLSLEEFATKLKEASTRLEKRALLHYLRQNPGFDYGQGLSETTPRQVWEERERQYREDYLRFMLRVCKEAIAEEDPDEQILEPVVYCLLDSCWYYRLDNTDPSKQVGYQIKKGDPFYLSVVKFLADEKLYQLDFTEMTEAGRYIRWSLWLFFRLKPWNRARREPLTWQIDGQLSYVPEFWFDAIIRSRNVDLFWDREFVNQWKTHGKIAVAKLAAAIRESEEPLLYMLALVKILERDNPLRDFLASQEGEAEAPSPSGVCLEMADDPFSSLGF